MKRHGKTRLFLALVCALAIPAWAAAQTATTSSDLQRVLSAMDKAAASFRGAEANFVWDQYQKIVDETDTQKGKIYFRRNGSNIEMAADITEPDKKYVLYSGGKVQVYQPKIEQVTVYNAGKNKADFETFIVLGFGGSGRDLKKVFDVKYAGMEKVNGQDTAKLELTPTSAKVRNTFQHITLWIDLSRGVSVQQQFVEPSGDYRLAKYNNIQMNSKIPDSAFKLKTTGQTKTITP